MNDAGLLTLSVATPGWMTVAWIILISFSPLMLVLFGARVLPVRWASLPEGVRAGLPLGFGLIGALVATIGSWLVTSNGAWRDDDTLYLRASRAFVAQVPLDSLALSRSAPLALDALSPAGRIRVPGYAAGLYRDAKGRRVFVLWAGQPLTRIPTDRDYDIAAHFESMEALQ